MALDGAGWRWMALPRLARGDTTIVAVVLTVLQGVVAISAWCVDSRHVPLEPNCLGVGLTLPFAAAEGADLGSALPVSCPQKAHATDMHGLDTAMAGMVLGARGEAASDGKEAAALAVPRRRCRRMRMRRAWMAWMGRTRLRGSRRGARFRRGG